MGKTKLTQKSGHRKFAHWKCPLAVISFPFPFAASSYWFVRWLYPLRNCLFWFPQKWQPLSVWSYRMKLNKSHYFDFDQTSRICLKVVWFSSVHTMLEMSFDSSFLEGKLYPFVGMLNWLSLCSQDWKRWETWSVQTHHQTRVENCSKLVSTVPGTILNVGLFEKFPFCCQRNKQEVKLTPYLDIPFGE